MIGDAIRELVRLQGEQLERACEASLVDERGRGVLVHDRLDLDALSSRTTVELSPLVPWATIHRHEVVGTGPCATCEAA